MSKESYIRGFCKAAEAAGVDPVQLAKYASDGVIHGEGAQNAGVGSYYDNSWDWAEDASKDPASVDRGKLHAIPLNSKSYIGRLLRRHPGHTKGESAPVVYPTSFSDGALANDQNPSAPVTLNDLEFYRKLQAGANAMRLAPHGSVPYKRIVDNLINAGKENYQSYLETRDTKERAEPDLKGIEKIKLTPEEKKQLLQMQNTMARNGAPRRTNIA